MHIHKRVVKIIIALGGQWSEAGSDWNFIIADIHRHALVSAALVSVVVEALPAVPHTDLTTDAAVATTLVADVQSTVVLQKSERSAPHYTAVVLGLSAEIHSVVDQQRVAVAA